MNRIEANDQRRMWKYLVFGILSFGIYSIYFEYKMIGDLNRVCGYVEERDDNKSPNYFLKLLFTILTFSIYNWYWWYKQGNRLKETGRKYGQEIEEKGSTYILWNLFGIWLLGIGPFISMALFIGNLNKLAYCYNKNIRSEQQSNGWDGGNPPISSGGYPAYGQTAGSTQKPISGGGSSVNLGGYGGASEQLGMDVFEDRPTIETIGINRVGTIKCIRGSYAGAEMTLNDGDELVIGRNSALSQLVISDSDISRKHCSIKYQNGYFYVTDLRSTCGTMMNGSQKLPADIVTKCPVGTKLTLGNGNNVFLLQ